MNRENEIAATIVDAALRIHRELGPGLLESVYEAVLTHELGKRGLQVTQQQPLPVEWDGLRLDVGFRTDLVIEDLVVVELKSIEQIGNVHKKQLLTYLRLGKWRLGLLINFNVELIKHGITRVVNGLSDERP